MYIKWSTSVVLSQYLWFDFIYCFNHILWCDFVYGMTKKKTETSIFINHLKWTFFSSFVKRIKLLPLFAIIPSINGWTFKKNHRIEITKDLLGRYTDCSFIERSMLFYCRRFSLSPWLERTVYLSILLLTK